MIRKFKFWCQMFIENIKDRFRPESGFRVKDRWDSSMNVWFIDVYDVLDKKTVSYVLSFFRHHDRYDFLAHELSESGIDCEVFTLTSQLERDIENYIIKKVC